MTDAQQEIPEAAAPTMTVAKTAEQTAMSRRSIASLATQSGWDPAVVEQGHILIFPSYVRQISELHQVKLEMVKVDTDPEVGDLYPMQGKWAATKQTLERMERMAGVQWDDENSHGEYPEPGIYSYTAVGGVRGPAGVMQWKVASREWIRDVELMEIEERAAGRKGGIEGNGKYIREEMARALKHRLSNTQTKAKNRVRREILGLPGSAPLDYWAKPFFIPRIDFLIDPNNAATRERVMDDAFNSKRILGFAATRPAVVDTTDATTVEILDEEAPAS